MSVGCAEEKLARSAKIARLPIATVHVHVHLLCDQNNVTWVYANSLTQARATPRGRWMKTPPVTTLWRYFVALHELGHVLMPKQSGKTRLEQEAAAWEWALQTCMMEPTPAVWAHVLRCLDSYIGRATRWKSMKIPRSEHVFWTLYNRAARQARANEV